MVSDKLPFPFQKKPRERTGPDASPVYLIDINGQKAEINTFEERDSISEAIRLPNGEFVFNQTLLDDKENIISESSEIEGIDKFPRYEYTFSKNGATFSRMDYAGAALKLIKYEDYVGGVRNLIGAYDPEYVANLEKTLSQRVQQANQQDSSKSRMFKSYNITIDNNSAVIVENSKPPHGITLVTDHKKQGSTRIFISGSEYKNLMVL